jgi:hypothetical protein
MIFLTFLPSAFVVMMVCSVVMGARSVDVDVDVEGSRDMEGSLSGVASAVCAGGDCTSAMFCGVVRWMLRSRWCRINFKLHERPRRPFALVADRT